MQSAVTQVFENPHLLTIASEERQLEKLHYEYINKMYTAHPKLSPYSA